MRVVVDEESFVSVIVPTQGRRTSLAAALRSVLAQTHAALEVIVVDDAVPAESAAWRAAPELAAIWADARVRVVAWHRGAGCAAAKNAGLAAARGAWVSYLDDDNVYRPTKVAAQLARARSSGSPVVLCGLEVRASGRRRRRQCEAAAWRGDEVLLRAVADTNVLFHRRDVGVVWREELRTVDDLVWLLDAMERRGLRGVPSVPEPLVEYAAHVGVRANRDVAAIRRGQRRAAVRAARLFGKRARRVFYWRARLAETKWARGAWGRLMVEGFGLLRAGGLGEWRVVVNAIGMKLPGVRRWMVT